jgi:hypothetical protein
MVMDDWQMLKMVVINCLTRGSGTFFDARTVLRKKPYKSNRRLYKPHTRLKCQRRPASAAGGCAPPPRPPAGAPPLAFIIF